MHDAIVQALGNKTLSQQEVRDELVKRGTQPTTKSWKVQVSVALKHADFEKVGGNQYRMRTPTTVVSKPSPVVAPTTAPKGNGGSKFHNDSDALSLLEELGMTPDYLKDNPFSPQT